MRLKSHLFVQSVMRAHSVSGHFSTILSKGADDAGAIFICHLKSDGSSDFYGQVPQSFFTGTNPADRFFELLDENLEQAELSSKLESQKQFDSDIWVIELEGDILPTSINILDTSV